MKFSFDEINCFVFGTAVNTVLINCEFIRPIHIVMASCVHNYTNKSIAFTNHAEYANNMRYHTPLDIDTIDGTHHSKAIKLRASFDNDDQVTKVINVIEQCSSLDASTVDTLQTIIAELFQNFYAHAEDRHPPICCVQSWVGQPFIEISIADKGIGIAKSLEVVLQTEEYLDKNPCQIACISGVSSKLGNNHSGYGLYFTKRFIEENCGRMFLISGNKCYENIAGVENNIIMPFEWKGTAIRLLINKNQSINCTEFFRSMSIEQGENDEDFF